MKEEEHNKCVMCQGYGWWPFGNLVPIGPMDASDYGMMTTKCPWCGAGTIKDKDRYAKLEGLKKEKKWTGK